MPPWMLIVAVLGGAFVILPLVAMSTRVNWAEFVPLVTSESSLAALLLSLRTSAVATALCIVLGTPMALALARTSFPGQRILRSLVLLPLVLPPVVGGIALLATFGRRGLLGQHFEVLGIQIAFSTTAVVLAQTFVALPFLVLSLEGALRTVGTRYEAIAATLGATPTTVLGRVTLPLMLPALVSGAVLSFARALGEFGATLTFAGSLQGVTRTLPLEIYLQRETDPDAAVALSLVLVVVAVLVVGLAHRAAEPGPRRGRASGRRDAPAARRGGAVARDPGPVAEAVSSRLVDAPALSLAATIAARGVDIGLELRPGETLAVLGPNGAGKSSLLGVVSGLVRPDSGRATLGGEQLFELDTAAPTRWTPAHRREVALLAQDALLFPHLSALDNVAFGPRSSGAGRKAAAARASAWLAEVEAGDLASSRPGELSGGQAQRVALARALAAEPRLLMLDEPLAALDVTVTPMLRRMLRRVLEHRTAIIVTHEVLDALTLADRVIVMNAGVIVEQGPTREVLERPRHPFTADIAGLSLLTGVRTRRGLRTPDEVEVEAEPEVAIPDGVPVALALRPGAVTLALETPPSGSVNVLREVVTELEPRGDLIRVRSERLSADVTAATAARLDLAPGTLVHFCFDPADAVLYQL